MYTLPGCSTFLPVLHDILSYGVTPWQDRLSLNKFLSLTLLNFTGAAIYTARIPERWYPHRFDI